MKSEITQRAGVLSELPQVLRDLGADVSSAFDGCRIDPATLTPDTRVPFEAMLNVLQKASLQTNCPNLGLIVGLRCTLAIHGPIGKLMQAASSLREALIDFVKWQPGYSSGAIVYLNPFGDKYAFGYSSYAASSPGSRILYDGIIGVGIQMLRELTKGAVKPLEIHFSHRQPKDPLDYARLLRLPIRFNQHRTCLIIDAEAMRTPLPGADPKGRQTLLAEFKRARFNTAPDVSTRTRHALRHVLHTGKPTLSGVASTMGLHPRTLGRRLAAEGQTFGALREEVRFSVARELLELTDIPVGEIGAILAYASPSVFSEAFSRISGTPPSAWRARASGIRRAN